MKRLSKEAKCLMKEAVKEFYWFIHNVSTDRCKALQYGFKRFDYGLYAGLIDDDEYKRLCLYLPFETYLK